ncbi:MAG: hypothetical protein H6721_13980 [Sandaracinus sp.]|nr:hypothetical protein [Sandaracinus sp.]
MNRIALCFALLTAFGSVAHAQGPAGSFGAGMESPLAVGPLFDGPTYLRMPGLSLRFQVSESFGIQAIAAIRTGHLRQRRRQRSRHLRRRLSARTSA